MSSKISRRDFLRGAVVTSLLGSSAFADTLRYFKPMHVENPLAYYPNRGWESAYRDIFRADSSFVFLCAPNDTHNCLLKSYVKNGVVVRLGPTFGYGKAKDLSGNQASHRWDPRTCQKGLALGRRFYGDRRIKAPMIRKGFLEWVNAGFPRDAKTGKPDVKYFNRGRDAWLRISWDEAYKISAQALANISAYYAGASGAEKLTEQGYDPAMIAAMKGAGTQTIKFRGGMAFLGATRIFGLYRFANMLALLDAKQRGVGPDKAIGGKGWDSYSWHTDLPPGHPMVTGMQTNDFDLFTIENSKLALIWGMNWITTKMPDSHWLTEARLKGTKVVVITVEYSATAGKGDEVIIIRPGTDCALALGIAQVMMAQGLYDKEFVQKNTDLPFLVRMDTLQYLRPEEVIPNYVAPTIKNVDEIIKGEKRSALSQANQYATHDIVSEFKPFLVWDQIDRKRSWLLATYGAKIFRTRASFRTV